MCVCLLQCKQCHIWEKLQSWPVHQKCIAKVSDYPRAKYGETCPQESSKTGIEHYMLLWSFPHQVFSKVPLSCSAELPPQEQLPSCSKSPGAGDSTKDSRTPVCKRKALSRAKAALPLSPRKFFHTVNDLIATASPRKQALFQSSQFKEKKKTPQHRIGEKVLKRLRELQKKRDEASQRTRTCLLSVCSKYSSIRASSTLYSISRKTASKYVSPWEEIATKINTANSTEVYQKKKEAWGRSVCLHGDC